MVKTLRKLLFFIVVLTFVFGMYYAYIRLTKPWKSIEASANENSKDENQTDIDSDDNGSDVKSNIDATLSENVQAASKIQLPVEYISQLPELPTGCEITSLATVLNYMGYSIDKEVLADKYLKKLDDLDGSFNNYFIGSPWSEDGWGCFAPAIVNAANKYLTTVKSDKKAYNITGCTLPQLFSELQNGHPVIVWITTNLDEKTNFTYIELNNGTTFKWPQYEHCVVLIGYDLSNPKSVILSDPLEGIVSRDYTKFNSRYNELGKRAVVIE